MTHDQVVIVLTTAAWSGGVGIVGGLVLWMARRASVRWLTVGVAAVAVLAVIAGTIATSRAMFISEPRPRRHRARGGGGGRRRPAVRVRGRCRDRPLVAPAARGGPALR